MKAIHMKKFKNETWELCSDKVFQSYRKTVTDASDYFKEFFNRIPSGRVMFYAGDVDMACNFVGVEAFSEYLRNKMKFEVKNEYMPWEFEDSDGSIQIGGFIRQFERITFVTVKGAGHMVPTDKPIPAKAMIKNFLNGDF